MTFQTRGYQILVVEDEPVEAEMITRRLARAGYESSIALSGAKALEMIRAGLADLVLLDLSMPDMDGLELLREMRRHPGERFVPIIIVSAIDDTASIVTAIQEGANDYITKPVEPPILLARMETQLKMASLLANLETQTRILAKLAAYDHLTGIYNRRSLFDVLESEVDRSRRMRHPLSVLMIDLDHFKNVNDQFGHATGDRVLTDSCKRIRAALRSMDVIARYGGEEFCAILPETNASSAARTAERVRQAIAESPFEPPPPGLGITVSIGAATMRPDLNATSALLLEQADQALYEAKRTGRNRVCAHGTA